LYLKYYTTLQTTRDEHLMLVVLVMILVDLIVLLPWYFVDPIKCQTQLWKHVSKVPAITTTTNDIDRYRIVSGHQEIRDCSRPIYLIIYI